jgi:hypothetical protein
LLTLTAGVEYYFYEDASIPGDISGDLPYSGGSGYYTFDSTSGYTADQTVNFLVTGDAVSPTPEPSSFVLLGTGLLGVAGALRRRSWVS